MKVQRQPDQKIRQELISASYIPALNRGFLTPLYDFFMKWAARESIFKPMLVRQAGIRKQQRVLDVGCGTATLTILIKKSQPEAEVVGLDADPAILEIAMSKAATADVDISLDVGTATSLPYPDSSFDHVFASMILHHLTGKDKIQSLKESFRVLKPEGQLHIADIAQPYNIITQLASLIISRLEEASDNVKDLLPKMLLTAGFDQVTEIKRYGTIFGAVALYKARKPTTSE